jgi:hypothetical protein
MDEAKQIENEIEQVKRKTKFLSNLCFVFAFIVLFGGYFFLQHVAIKIDQTDRQDLLTRVETIARIINTEDIEALTGLESDVTSPTYQKVKRMLYDIHDLNANTRFVYFMRSNATKDKLVFLVDSESPNSKDYSPPGQVYEDTSELQMSNYINAVSFTEGPYTDSWGTWVSGYSPVWSGGKLVGIVGMDISASKWQNEDSSFQIGLAVITLMGSLSLLFAGIFIRQESNCIHCLK